MLDNPDGPMSCREDLYFLEENAKLIEAFRRRLAEQPTHTGSVTVPVPVNDNAAAAQPPAVGHRTEMRWPCLQRWFGSVLVSVAFATQGGRLFRWTGIAGPKQRAKR